MHTADPIFQPGYYSERDLRHAGFKSVGEDVRISRNCTIIGVENISIGDHVRIDGYCSIFAGGAGYLTLGAYIHIGSYCHLAARGGIVMEDFSGLSQGVKVYSCTDDYHGEALTNPTVPGALTKITEGRVLIKRHVIVGSSSVLFPGITLEEGVAVGALSLVNRSLEAWAIYGGIPAKRIRDRSKNLLNKERSLIDPFERC